MRKAFGSLLLIVTACLVPPEEAAAPALPELAPAAPLIDEPTETKGAAVDDAATPSVILVVFDGARWQEIFHGTDPALGATVGLPRISAEKLLPNLYRLISRGAVLGAPDHGAVISASGPNFISLPGYTEIFTGRPPTACKDNDCAPPSSNTMLDDLSDAAPDAGVAVFSSWPKIGRVASSRTTFDAHADYRPDAQTSDLALAYLEEQKPRFLFVGLGDTDEEAHLGHYRGYVEALRSADRTIGRIVEALGRMGPRGEATSIVVTADHGRARDYRHHGGEFPESARVWLVAAGPRIPARGYVSAPRERHLADVAPTLRAVLGVAPGARSDGGAVLSELFE